jgi:perosamine synthetase
MATNRIPVCSPLLAGNELKYVEEALRGGWISSSGPFVERLERSFAEYVGARFAVTTTSGTTALHLACVALGLGPGDEVVMPTFTMIASAFAVCYTGAKPVFVDCERTTWTLDPRKLEACLGPRTKAIMPVDIYGHPCDMGPIRELAAARGIPILEDAAEAIGSEYRGTKCGALSEIAAFSLFANKAITTGEGGLVTTSDVRLDERCRYFKNLCFPTKGPRNYVHEEIGFNYRLPNTLAAIGMAQLERVDFYVSRRRENASLYAERLRGVRGVTLQPELPWAKNSYWMNALLIEDDFGPDRDDVMRALGEKGIETRLFFVPMHRQPSLLRFGCSAEGDFPVSEDISKRGLYLPSGSGLSVEEIDRVCDALKGLARR